ncbi:hypothetical protein BDZ94DRAFT_1277185, partial [Collybia nuda]
TLESTVTDMTETLVPSFPTLCGFRGHICLGTNSGVLWVSHIGPSGDEIHLVKVIIYLGTFCDFLPIFSDKG